MTWRVLAVVVALLFSESDCPLLAQQPAAPRVRVRRDPHTPVTAVVYETPPTVADTPIDAMAKWIANGGKPLPPENLQPAPTDEALLLPVELSCTATGASSFAFAVGTTNPPPTIAANTPECTFLATQGNPGQTVYWRVTAKNAVGESSSPIRSFVVGGSTIVPASADLVTGGQWRTSYGRDGYLLAGDGAMLPSYATVSLADEFQYTWTEDTGETRALQRPDASGYFAATWYRAPSFTVTVQITDGRLHRVSFYALDWDYGGRVERLEAMDATSGQVVDTRTATDFAGGVYASYVLSGRVVFRFVHVAGPNAVLAGIFFDPPTSQLALTWEPNAEREAIVRYEIGIGPTRGTYAQTVSVGLATSWDVRGIPEDGKAYWIAVRAVNATGASPFSAPIAVVFVPPEG